MRWPRRERLARGRATSGRWAPLLIGAVLSLPTTGAAQDANELGIEVAHGWFSAITNRLPGDGRGLVIRIPFAVGGPPVRLAAEFHNWDTDSVQSRMSALAKGGLGIRRGQVDGSAHLALGYGTADGPTGRERGLVLGLGLAVEWFPWNKWLGIHPSADWYLQGLEEGLNSYRTVSLGAHIRFSPP